MRSSHPATPTDRRALEATSVDLFLLASAILSATGVASDSMRGAGLSRWASVDAALMTWRW
jgi:hypothetical protein